MNTTHHTPGPWHRARFEDEDADCIIGPAGDERICEMRGNESTDANARLIAAAPELLVAIEQYLTWVPMTGSDRAMFHDIFTAAVQKATEDQP